MDSLAFAPVALAVAKLQKAQQAAVETAPSPPVMPEFKRRWWFKAGRLDARPVAWSLRNKPEDWDWAGSLRYRIIHKPSKHEFWVANGRWFYRLYDADCSCSSTRGYFQLFQQGTFGRAFKHWRRWHNTKHLAPIAEQFASHFK